MTRGSVLVIDAGSSRLRCHLFDCEARTVALSAVEWTYLEEPDAPSTAKAFDPRRIWEACCRAVRR
ncbi:MAG: hypothetical protein J4N27_00005, partial [Chloroflexi bacterium]|nr:hypothetical protein [Chloroflexota bacterium]